MVFWKLFKKSENFEITSVWIIKTSRINAVVWLLSDNNKNIILIMIVIITIIMMISYTLI